MKKILLLTTIYPIPNSGKETEVCHFFAREWVKLGHDVRVYHLHTNYPAPYYWAARCIGNYIAARTGAIVYKSPDKGGEFNRDGVSITRIPLRKNIPHGKFHASSISNAINKIDADCNKSYFVPDLIVGHFPNPQIQILYELKKRYPQATTAVVLHLIEEISQLKSVYGNSLQKYMESIDVWGFRFEHLRDIFKQIFPRINRTFICYSGIPKEYINDKCNRDFSNGVKKYIYVGGMIERKYPTKVLEALYNSFPSKDFSLVYIGEGKQAEKIKSIIKEKHLTECVSLLGKLPRISILDNYDSADCMVMISKGEAFGLVYVEAMARGCITIGSRCEGIDGVIVDGVNGFLCEAGNSEELSSIIRRINSMSPNELNQISQAAVETAKSLTDFLAAKRYINDVIKLANDE